MQTPKKKKPCLKGITPIKTPTGSDRFIGKDGRMTVVNYGLALVINFLFAGNCEESMVNSIVYGIEYIIDGEHYFKIGSTDILHNKKTPFGTKTGRICSSLKSLGKQFEKVRIEKIHFIIKEDSDRDLFKLGIEAYLLNATKEDFVNPGEDMGLKLREFRSMDGILEYFRLVRELCGEHELVFVVV